MNKRKNQIFANFVVANSIDSAYFIFTIITNIKNDFLKEHKTACGIDSRSYEVTCDNKEIIIIQSYILDEYFKFLLTTKIATNIEMHFS